MFSELKDSLNSVENYKEIIQKEYQFKYEKKQRETRLVLHKEKEKAVAKQFISYVSIFILFIIITVIFIFRSFKIKAEKKSLLQEVEILKDKSLISKKVLDSSFEKSQLDRVKIKKAINGSINGTDWKILSLLYKNPHITNREISEQVFLSIEGVKSSLKKMYTLFNIQHSRENKRLGLVITITLLSNDV